MTRPLVSVLMNCYNGEKYLRAAIDSVRAQTYQHWEIIFWDNQSTDASASIATSYGDDRIRYFYAPSHTVLYAAREAAIQQCRGDLIAFLDVDDWWAHDKLARQIPLFDDPSVGFACGDFWVEDEQNGTRWLHCGREIPSGWVLDALLESDDVVGILTLIVRRSALQSLDHGCDPRYNIIGDRDLVVRLAIMWKMACVQAPVAHFRVHGANMSRTQFRRIIDEMRIWIPDLERIQAIRSSPSWHSVPQALAYLEALTELLEGNRLAATRHAARLPWGRRRLNLHLATLLPTPVVRRLKK